MLLATISPLFCIPMKAINKPIPTAIAPRTHSGIPSKMTSRIATPLILITDKSKKIMPEIRTSNIALPKVTAAPARPPAIKPPTV